MNIQGQVGSRKRLTVKAVKNLLGLRKKKEVMNEETPNLAVVMAASAKAGGSTATPSSPVEHGEDDMPEMEDVETYLRRRRRLRDKNQGNSNHEIEAGI